MNMGSYLLTCLLGGMQATIIFILAFKLFDIMTPGWSFEKAFNGERFNGGSIVIAAFFIGLAIIISRVAS